MGKKKTTCPLVPILSSPHSLSLFIIFSLHPSQGVEDTSPSTHVLAEKLRGMSADPRDPSPTHIAQTRGHLSGEYCPRIAFRLHQHFTRVVFSTGKKKKNFRDETML